MNIKPKRAPFLFGVGGAREGAAIQSNARRLAGQLGGAMSHPVRLGSASYGTPETLQADVEPLISLAMLELGVPQHVGFPGSIIAPDITKDRWTMNYWSWTGAPQLQIGEEGLERAFSAARRRVNFTGSTTTTKMTRRGVEVPLDVDEILISENQLQMAAHASALSRDMVKLAVEREKQQLFGVAASYPASHSVDLTGSEWNAAGGDSLGDIDTLTSQMVTANPPYQRESIHLVITYAARDAAFADPTFIALDHGPVNQGRYPSMEDLATYWGVGQVSLADVVFDPGTGTVASMWGDTVVGFIDDRLQGGIVSEWGRRTFGVNFTFAGSVSSAPYHDPTITSNLYPFDGYDHPAMIQGAAGYLLYNVKA